MGFWGTCRQMLAGSGNEARDVPRSITSHLAMRQWGIEDKTPMPDTGLINGQGVYNRPLMRPAYSRFLITRSMALVAPATKTPWPSVNWVPTPPHRTAQVTKSGGRQPIQPGMISVQQMQQYHQAVPVLQSGLSGMGLQISRALSGG